MLMHMIMSYNLGCERFYIGGLVFIFHFPFK